MVPAASTPNQTNGVDLAHSAIRVAPQLLLFANSHASLYAQRCATTVMGNPNSQTPLSATAERLQIKFERTVFPPKLPSLSYQTDCQSPIRRRLPPLLRKPSAPTQVSITAQGPYRSAPCDRLPLPLHGPFTTSEKGSCRYPPDVAHPSSFGPRDKL
ncbi:hypothetical protein HBH75_188810 [Parastagonospora nodorum]|nr:hypothetical protein HBH75_188810 [Parastagonospora nodorum]